jgi:hypothetical protein
MKLHALVLFSLLSLSCSKEEEPACTRDSQCASATTSCTIGLCKEGTCLAQPVAEGTRVADQSPVKDKFCVVLKCDKTGKAVEMADGSRVPSAQVACKKSFCEGTTLKTENIMDGVPCDSDKGTCRGGVCQPNTPGDTGPTPMDTGVMETDVDAATD